MCGLFDNETPFAAPFRIAEGQGPRNTCVIIDIAIDLNPRGNTYAKFLKNSIETVGGFVQFVRFSAEKRCGFLQFREGLSYTLNRIDLRRALFMGISLLFS